jgi:hypothetical protein
MSREMANSHLQYKWILEKVLVRDMRAIASPAQAGGSNFA